MRPCHSQSSSITRSGAMPNWRVGASNELNTAANKSQAMQIRKLSCRTTIPSHVPISRRLAQRFRRRFPEPRSVPTHSSHRHISIVRFANVSLAYLVAGIVTARWLLSKSGFHRWGADEWLRAKLSRFTILICISRPCVPRRSRSSSPGKDDSALG